jgi:hypothetical protein
MPAAETILSGLSAVANEWRSLAIAWHIVLVALVVALGAGWRPSVRLLAFMMIAPLASVMLAAWRSGNSFTGTLFVTLVVALVFAAVRLPAARVEPASPARAATGIALVVFGATYPHFVRADSWLTYLYASPLGLLPCPTLSAVIGGTLIVSNLRAGFWSAMLAMAGSLYGAIGVFRLGVTLDVVLLLASGILMAVVTRGSARRQPAPESVAPA